MAETMTWRPDDDDREIMDKIRKFLLETTGKPSETQVLRYALRAADRELARKHK